MSKRVISCVDTEPIISHVDERCLISMWSRDGVTLTSMEMAEEGFSHI